MRAAKFKTLGAAQAASGLLILALGITTGRGEEPSRLGRLFRFGGSSSPAPVTKPPVVEPLPEGRPITDPVPAIDVIPPSTVSSSTPAGPQPRLLPQPRISRPATEADPIVSRISLGRSDDGRQFGMFLQVFADGTVIDSEGVHHAGREGIKDVLHAIESSELYRLKGHCGAPSTDFVEMVHLVVFERSLGRLRANAFSFSGNPQGCDQSVRHLQAVLDALQTRLSRPTSDPAPAASPDRPSPVPASAPLIQLDRETPPIRPLAAP